MSNLAGDLLLHHFIVICDFLFLMEREGERGGGGEYWEESLYLMITCISD